MIGERTLYRQIQVVLDYVKRHKHNSIEKLVDYIYHRKPTNFIYYWRDRESNAIKHDYSQKSIQNTVLLCLELKLINFRSNTISLSRSGVAACDPRRFPAIIGDLASTYLDNIGISIDTINNAIYEAIRGNEPMPPTANALWEYIYSDGIEIDFTNFKRLINLLGHGKRLLASQKRIYLPQKPKE